MISCSGDMLWAPEPAGHVPGSRFSNASFQWLWRVCRPRHRLGENRAIAPSRRCPIPTLVSWPSRLPRSKTFTRATRLPMTALGHNLGSLCWVLLVDRVRHPNDRGGRDVCVSRLGLPILLVQAQPVRPSREEQTYQTLVSGQRPCEPKHPSPRLTAPGWYVLTVRTIRASFTRDRGLLGACETTSEKQALCEKAVSDSAARLGYQP